MTYTTEIIRPLVDQCKDCLPKLLSWLSKHNFTHIGRGRPLTIQRVNQILKIVRESNEPDLLSGAFIALSTSKFIKSAGVDGLLKLCHFDSRNLASTGILFNSREVALFVETQEIDSKENRIVEDVAKQIISNPKNFAYRLVCSAAKYLADNSPLNLPPLAKDEEQLKIYV
jgi:hypothetical protein